MQKYEGMFIIRPNLEEETYAALVSEIEKVFSDHNSTVTEVKIWGLRDLAYEIDYLRKGYYVLFKTEATPEAVLEYDRICNIRENILRHILVKE